MMKHVWLPEYLPNNAPPKHSFAWFEQFLPKSSVEKKAIGSYNTRR